MILLRRKGVVKASDAARLKFRATLNFRFARPLAKEAVLSGMAILRQL
jgi:hypothetical protein